jgi:hypothetical protein
MPATNFDRIAAASARFRFSSVRDGSSTPPIESW